MLIRPPFFSVCKGQEILLLFDRQFRLCLIFLVCSSVKQQVEESGNCFLGLRKQFRALQEQTISLYHLFCFFHYLIFLTRSLLK